MARPSEGCPSCTALPQAARATCPLALAASCAAAAPQGHQTAAASSCAAAACPSCPLAAAVAAAGACRGRLAVGCRHPGRSAGAAVASRQMGVHCQAAPHGGQPPAAAAAAVTGDALQTALGHRCARHLAGAAGAAAAAAAPAVTLQTRGAAPTEAAGCLQTAGRLQGAEPPALVAT